MDDMIACLRLVFFQRWIQKDECHLWQGPEVPRNDYRTTTTTSVKVWITTLDCINEILAAYGAPNPTTIYSA
jgi:hypothetical protein